jgi:uncharacterized protein YqgV (UPF0045/DUF77 family)
MNTQVNWQKIRNEFSRITDVESLKTEVQKIRKELSKFDLNSVLSPAAAEKVKAFEKRYSILMRTVHQAQRQVDREFNRILREIKVRRADVNRVVNDQKSKLEKASSDLRKYWARTAKNKTAAPAAKKSTGTKKKASAKTGARKSKKKA